MTEFRFTRTTTAPIEFVFATISNPHSFSKVSDDVVGIEMLSDNTSGVGTRFRESRRMGKREATTDLEITEWVENDRVRFVSDAGGAIWDTVYSVKAERGGTRMEVVMEARPHKLKAKIMVPLIKGMVRKFMAKDMDAVTAYCDAAGSSGGED
jgi:hypothetical protein